MDALLGWFHTIGEQCIRSCSGSLKAEREYEPCMICRKTSIIFVTWYSLSGNQILSFDCNISYIYITKIIVIVVIEFIIIIRTIVIFCWNIP